MLENAFLVQYLIQL